MTATANWYDYPEYFDLAFADETAAEADFIEAACAKYATGRVRRVLEIGCGGGRLVEELLRRGYAVLGLDNNPASLAYVRKRLKKLRPPRRARLLLADMAAFRLPQPVDAIVNTFNTFRHLTTEAAAVSHLRCVAQALRPGGIFVLGLHVMPPDASPECTERWTAVKGHTKVVCTLRVLSTNSKARLESMRVTMWVRGAGKGRGQGGELRLATEFPLRLYSAAQLRRLLKKAPDLELCDVFDFWYKIDEPLRLDEEIADTVLVLRRR